jgi:hypothetical protein
MPASRLKWKTVVRLSNENGRATIILDEYRMLLGEVAAKSRAVRMRAAAVGAARSFPGLLRSDRDSEVAFHYELGRLTELVTRSRGAQ